MSDESIVKVAEKHVRKVFRAELDPAYEYHNLAHTIDVLRAVRKLSKTAGMTEAHQEILEIAALFHDIGYCESHEEHENRGAAMAAAFLRNNSYNESSVHVIQSCILSTKVDVQPDNKLEQMLCDADLSYLGSSSFFDRGDILRREWEVTLHQEYEDAEWLRLNYEFLTQHRFYTPEAIKLYGPSKKRNMLELQLRMAP